MVIYLTIYIVTRIFEKRRRNCRFGYNENVIQLFLKSERNILQNLPFIRIIFFQNDEFSLLKQRTWKKKWRMDNKRAQDG